MCIIARNEIKVCERVSGKNVTTTKACGKHVALQSIETLTPAQNFWFGTGGTSLSLRYPSCNSFAVGSVWGNSITKKRAQICDFNPPFEATGIVSERHGVSSPCSGPPRVSQPVTMPRAGRAALRGRRALLKAIREKGGSTV